MNRSEEARSELKGLYEEWSKQKEIVDRLKKRIEECKTNSNGISAKDNWTEYKFQIALIPELKKLLGEEK